MVSFRSYIEDLRGQLVSETAKQRKVMVISLSFVLDRRNTDHSLKQDGAKLLANLLSSEQFKSQIDAETAKIKANGKLPGIKTCLSII